MDEDSSQTIREPFSDLYEMTLDPSMALQLEPSSPSDTSVLDPTSRDFILNIETTSNRENSESSSTEEMEVTKRLSSLNVGKLTRLVTSMKPPDSGIVSTGRTKQRRRRRRKSALKRKRKRKLACAANSESETKKLRSLASPRLSETEEKEKSSDKETVVMDDGSIKSNSSYTPKMIDSPADEPQLKLTEEAIRRLGHVVRGPRIDYTDACSSGEDSVFVNPPSPQACSFKFSNVLSKIEGGEETADERGRDGDDEESCVEGEMIARAIPWWKREYPAIKSDQEEDEEFCKLLAMGKSMFYVTSLIGTLKLNFRRFRCCLREEFFLSNG